MTECRWRGADLISRRTIVSLLLTLLLAGGLTAWSVGRRDECSAYLAGVAGAPADEVVATGSHVMRVRCDEWFLRQPAGVQLLCLVCGAGFMVFGVSARADTKVRRQLCKVFREDLRRSQLGWFHDRPVPWSAPQD